ncbi:hypothetical protein ALC57_11710 [Trachymyrmex cornetzi]|uniref:Uncharacterized protein n=1 Tax=Trachymyrmex cornetzi TaxID=471704 RepID=A0A151J221_9HYME|nr:hypothetical protein ALC57_11710 [Trachymyrmex cornetzi]
MFQWIIVINIWLNKKKKYKVMSAIFHEGKEMNRDHYTCMLRTDKKSEWYGPSNCGKTNVLISLLESTHGVRFENVYTCTRNRCNSRNIDTWQIC